MIRQKDKNVSELNISTNIYSTKGKFVPSLTFFPQLRILQCPDICYVHTVLKTDSYRVLGARIGAHFVVTALYRTVMII